MKKYLPTILRSALMAVIASIPMVLYAYSGVNKGQEGFKTIVISAGSGAATLANDPAVMAALGLRHYNQVCIKNEDGNAGENVFIWGFDPTLPGDELTNGWKLVGTESQCYDWSESVPIHVSCNNGDACPKEVRFLFTK